MNVHEHVEVSDRQGVTLIRFLDRQLEQFFEELRRDFLRRTEFAGHVRDDLGLAHWFCHLVSFSSSELSVPSAAGSRRARATHGEHYTGCVRATQEKTSQKLELTRFSAARHFRTATGPGKTNRCGAYV